MDNVNANPPVSNQDSSHVSDSNSLSVRRENRLKITLALNLVIVFSQVGFGLIAHSLGLLADAGHNLIDVGAIFLSLVAVHMVRRAPTKTRTFGFHRAGVLAAQANAAAIIAATIFISYEGIRRLINPEPVDGLIVIIVASIATIANLGSILILREGHDGHGEHKKGSNDLNIQSAIMHLFADGLFSLGVAIAGLIILLTNDFYWLDPIVSLAIGAYIAYQAYKLMKSANEVLLESAPSHIDIAELKQTMKTDPGVDEVHDLHVWSLSTEVLALSAHLVINGHPTLEEAQVIGERIKSKLTKDFNIAHATLELECENCDDQGNWCSIDDENILKKQNDG